MISVEKDFLMFENQTFRCLVLKLKFLKVKFLKVKNP